MRVLVVDDDRDVAESTALVLRVMGHDTCAAYDGRQAVQTAATFHPEAIFLDLMMPDLDGYETARRIRAHSWGKDIILVALTALEGAEIQHRIQAAGFDHHWVKPVDCLTMAALLNKGGQDL